MKYRERKQGERGIKKSKGERAPRKKGRKSRRKSQVRGKKE
jgi:hypothetical protein